MGKQMEWHFASVACVNHFMRSETELLYSLQYDLWPPLRGCGNECK